jgi:predicted alpha-1,6-mannanase (GH76 family)
MNHAKYLSPLVLIGFAISLCGAAEAPDAFARQATASGASILKLIQDQFYLPKNKVYVQEIHSDVARKYAADAWASGIQLSAFTAAARVDPDKYLPDVKRYTAELDAYKLTLNGLEGYNSAIHARSPDRYYDDNAWLSLAFVEAFELTHDNADLNRAKIALKFVLSGEDKTLGGGLYWQENKNDTKNTCSNAPGLCAALRVAAITKDPELIAAANRLYDWTKANLQDSDGLYFDSLTVDKKLTRTKWTYNSALMIRAACLFYDQTHDLAYLKEAERIAAAAQAKWVRPATGALGGPACFAHLLAEAFLELSTRDHDPRWRQVDHTAVQFLWEHNRNSDGFFAEKWEVSNPDNSGKVRLITQASDARAFFRAAWPIE